MIKAKPLFRWAGGKTKMKSKYGQSFWPSKPFSKFIDPFFGSGSVSLWIWEKFPDTEFFVNDYNEDTINVFEAIKTDLECFIDGVNDFQSHYLPLSKEQRKQFYYDMRAKHAWQYDELSKTERASLLFSLLKTSFNGIWQNNQNTNGKFGTPSGLLNEKDSIFNEQQVRLFSTFAQNVNFSSGDFLKEIQHVDDSSFLYLDPPYRDCFTNYTTEGFDDNDQIRLVGMMNQSNDVGASVAMSNKYHFDDFFESRLNDGFETLTFDVKYTMGRGAKDVEKVRVTECLIKNWSDESKNLLSFFE